MLENTGASHAFGDAPVVGDAQLEAGEVDVAAVPTPSGGGIWVATDTGRVEGLGDAVVFSASGSSGAATAPPIVGMAATPSGQGYWLVADDGDILTFGDAEHHGSIPEVLGTVQLDEPIVAMAATATGDGYWLVASDGACSYSATRCSTDRFPAYLARFRSRSRSLAW